jgi:indole-3-pyruvate monooxygenase
MEATDVVVVGGGPSGLAVGACLQKRQTNFIILEREHQVGSSWRNYERLHLHTIKSRSSLPFRSLNRTYPRYVSRSDVVRYLEEYAASFKLKIRFGEDVRTARKHGNEWLIVRTQRLMLGRCHRIKRPANNAAFSRNGKLPRASPAWCGVRQCNAVRRPARLGRRDGKYRSGNRSRSL